MVRIKLPVKFIPEQVSRDALHRSKIKLIFFIG